jgi:hypothetical protein
MISVADLLQLIGALAAILSPLVWFYVKDASKRVDLLQKRLDECYEREREYLSAIAKSEKN